ncbi:MAG: hypothetical protein KF694_01795 [Mesorhizobium sp.]|nr:hypothetical protein [Mesorhizobium sp.]
MDKATASSRGRWLKAIDSDPLHYSDAAVIACWEASRDPRAAKIIVRRAQPEAVSPLLQDFITAGIEGWIIARGFIKAGSASDVVWASLREANPATYAYLCAKGLRSLTSNEAVSIIQDAPESYEGGKALAIWAVGQLRLEDALDQIWRQRTKLD